MNDSKVMFCALNGTSNVGFTKEKQAFIIITRVFSRAAKSARVRLIALSTLDRTQCARERAGLQGPCGATLNDDVRVTVDVDMRPIVGLTLDRRCARSHSQGNSYILLCLISTI